MPGVCYNKNKKIFSKGLGGPRMIDARGRGPSSKARSIRQKSPAQGPCCSTAKFFPKVLVISSRLCYTSIRKGEIAMIRVIVSSEAFAAEIAANENGFYYPLEDGTYLVLYRED